MAEFAGDEGLEGLDDALGLVVARKTNVQKRTLDQHDEKIILLLEEVERLKRLIDDRVDKEVWLREHTILRGDATEAATLAREVRHELVTQGSTLRDELTKQLRDELAAGLAAQTAVSTAQARAVADLQTSSTDHNGRLAAAEAALRVEADAQAARNTEFEERLASGMGTSGAQLEHMQEAVASANAQVELFREAAAAAHEEQERLRDEVAELKRQQKADHEAHDDQIELLKSEVSGIKLVLKEYLGVESTAIARLKALSSSKAASGGDSSGHGDHGSSEAPLADGNAGNGEQGRSAPPDAIPGAPSPAREPYAVSQAFAPNSPTIDPTATGLLGGPGLGPSHSGVGGGLNLPGQVSGMRAALNAMQNEWDTVRSQIQTTHDYLQDERLVNAARMKANEFKDESRTERLSKIEAQLSSTAPIGAVAELQQLRAYVGESGHAGEDEHAGEGGSQDLSSRLAALEVASARRHASLQEELERSQQEQTAELLQRIEEQLAEVSAASRDLLHPINLRLDTLTDKMEAAHAAAAAAMRNVSDEATELRAMIRDGINVAREELAAARGADRRAGREELSGVKEALSKDVGRINQQHAAMLRELRHRVSAAWEGMRESRVELGDVMQTLHHLVERSEIQHVVNQMVSRAAFAQTGPAFGSGPSGVPKHPLISPRVGLMESSNGNAASISPPMLPGALQHNHRRCLKRGECSCHERLAVTLGAGDPRVALDKLYDRQLRLLMSVRKLWQQAERSRGELPHIPAFPHSTARPLSGGAPTEARLSSFSDAMRREPHVPPNTSYGGVDEMEHEFNDRSRAGGDGPHADNPGASLAEGGMLGPVVGDTALPERLYDLL